MTSSEAPIAIVPYDPAWPAKFEEEAALLRHGLAPWLVGAIEHIGSTAVPGLAAKPVIDIMAGVETLEASRPSIAVATGLGYCYWPYQADLEHWFCKPSAAYRTHHLHLIPIGSLQWFRAIAFRDYLRAHPETAGDYAELKQRLAWEPTRPSRLRKGRSATSPGLHGESQAMTSSTLPSLEPRSSHFVCDRTSGRTGGLPTKHISI